MEANCFTILWWFLPYIDMNQPWVYMCSPSWTPLPPPSPSHPSGSTQCTSPEHPERRILKLKGKKIFYFLSSFIRQINQPPERTVSNPDPGDSLGPGATRPCQPYFLVLRADNVWFFTRGWSKSLRGDSQWNHKSLSQTLCWTQPIRLLPPLTSPPHPETGVRWSL